MALDSFSSPIHWNIEPDLHVRKKSSSPNPTGPKRTSSGQVLWTSAILLNQYALLKQSTHFQNPPNLHDRTRWNHIGIRHVACFANCSRDLKVQSRKRYLPKHFQQQFVNWMQPRQPSHLDNELSFAFINRTIALPSDGISIRSLINNEMPLAPQNTIFNHYKKPASSNSISSYSLSYNR